jgi:glycosyltransferase involved in cell wall biosynthesis
VDVLTILSVGYPLATLTHDSVGGAEQVLMALDRAIVAAGHRSIVIAPHGSTTCGQLRATAPAIGPFDDPAIHRCHEACRREIAGALAHDDVDVVHMHGVDFGNYMPRHVDVPIVATLHLWPNIYPPELIARPPRGLHLVCVSEAQRQACPNGAHLEVIANGVDVDSFVPAATRGDAALVLGRVCAEKGVHLAIDAAVAAGVPLTIAGEVFPYATHVAYFEREIAPRLGGAVRFVGPLGGAAKRQALASARCVIVPSVVPETSSLAAMEALASGTPVVAFRTPALADLIEDGRTGWLVDRVEDLPGAIARAGELRSDACRAAALARCSRRAMTQRYLATYTRLARTGVGAYVSAIEPELLRPSAAARSVVT